MRPAAGIEPGSGSFYTVAAMFDMLTSLLERLGSEAYDPWAILFELFLIGISVNWCAGVLQGTRGTRLLRGLLIVLVVVTLMLRLVSVQKDYTRLELLYSYFLIGLAFIALVAFQPELRRAFIRAGEVTFLWRGSVNEQVISALTAAARHLSRNRYGALIAIQRDVGLRNWAEHGTILNAEVSASLLNTIFFPNSPLHDLGVIIEGTRVLAANCQFPQAESGELHPSLGSRHRAAVGLSQESDALVLVVSEESGAISLADRGRLTRFLSLDQLEHALRQGLGGRSNPASGGGGRQWSDWLRVARRQAMVVPLTLVIWILADQATLIEAPNIELKLTIEHAPRVQVDITAPQPALFNAKLRGPTRAIDGLRAAQRAGPLLLEWNLPESFARAGLYGPAVGELIENLPEMRKRGLEVVTITPEVMTLQVDEVVTETLPVHIDPGPVQVSEVRVTPPEVKVAMRASDRDRLRRSLSREQQVVTARLAERLARLAPDQTHTLEDVVLEPRLDGLELLRLEPGRISVTLRVVGQHVQRTIKGLAVTLAVTPEFLERYTVRAVDANEWLIEVEVVGDRVRIESLRPGDIKAFLTVTSERAGRSTGAVESEAVEVALPEGVRLASRPPLVQFTISPREPAAQ